jgi:hypothetical protein
LDFPKHTPVQEDPHFLFLLSTTASPTICQTACTIEEDVLSDYKGDLFLPMSHVGNTNWVKFGSKRGIGAVYGQVDWLPSKTTPTSVCATLFFSDFFVGVPLPPG